MKKAWVENGRIRDVASGDPEELYHPDVAKFYDILVPDEAENGDGWDGVTLTKPVIPDPAPVEPPAPVPPKVSPVEFKLLFTAVERVAIKASTDPIVQDFFSIVEDTRLTHVDLGLQSTQDALAYLETLELIAAGRKAEILTGNVL